MKTFGEIIREERKKRGLYLRQVAAATDIDQAIISKFEKGERKPAKEQVLRFAKFFEIKKNLLLIAWLSDRVVYDLQEEKLASQVLKVAEEKIIYQRQPKLSRTDIKIKIKNYFKNEFRVIRAWIFGSFAREEDEFFSDIDLMIEFNKGKSISLLDLADIQFNLENITGKKIDIVEKGYIEPFAWENVKNDLKLIYG
jgi:predicted nucleotidyltransferase